MLIRLRHVSWSRLNERPPRDSVARYSLIGIVTSPNWIAPRHIARAMQDLLARPRPFTCARTSEPRAPTEYAPLASAGVADIVRCLARTQREPPTNRGRQQTRAAGGTAAEERTLRQTLVLFASLCALSAAC